MAFAPVDVFAQIVAGEIPADILLETDTVIAFRDINPKAKVHVLIVPKENLVTGRDVHPENLELFGELFLVAKQIADIEGLDGYKLHMNVGESGGQIIPHVHLHLLSPEFESAL